MRRALVPARLAPGVGVISITALDYRACDLGPYREVIIAVALNEPSTRPNLPGRVIADAVRRPERMHGFVWQLPVTTPVALAAGVDFYAFPKFLAEVDVTEVDVTEAGGMRSWGLSEHGEHVLTLAHRTLPAGAGTIVDAFGHLFMEGQLQLAQVRLNRLRTGRTLRRDAATLELGAEHPVARALERMLLSRRPLQVEATPQMEAILFGPEHLTLPLLDRSLRALRVAEERTAEAPRLARR